MKKRFISSILVMAMAVGLLAGCGSKPAEQSSTSSPNPTEVTKTDNTQTKDSEKEQEQVVEENTYGDTGGLKLPLVDKPTKITWMLTSSVQGLNDKDVIKEIEKRTGVTLDILSYPQASYGDKLQITLASGNLPDIITGSTPTEVNKLGMQGAFAPINDYLDKLPNFKALYVDNEENNWVMKSYADEKGNVYTWPLYGLSRDVNHGFMYRKDIFDKHGIAEWTNTEEFYQAMKQLKEIYPQSTPIVSKTQDALLKDWAYGWGIGGLNYPMYYDESAGIWKLATIQAEYKDMIDFIKKLYNEGLLDPEFITDTAASWTAKMTSENGAFVTFDWIGRLDMFYEQVKETMPEYDLRYANPVGPTNNIRTLSKVNNFGIAVAKGKNEEIALKLLDYLTSPSGSELITLGIEGDHYVIDANGKVTYPNITDVDKVEITTLEERYGAWIEGMYLKVDPRSAYFNYTEKEQEAQDKINKNNSYEPLDPALSFSDSETAEMVELTTNLNKSGVEFTVQYILDKSYGDAEWANWLEIAKQQNAAQLEEIYNLAQERFNAN